MSDTTPRPDETTSDPTAPMTSDATPEAMTPEAVTPEAMTSEDTPSDAQPTVVPQTPEEVPVQDESATPAAEPVAPAAAAGYPPPPSDYPPAAADYAPPPTAAPQPPPVAYAPPPPPGQQLDYAQPAYAPGAQPMTPTDERTAGMAAHGVALAATVLSGGLLGFVAALVMYLVFRDRGPFVRHHTANALNVQIIVGIVMLVSIPLMFVLIGFVTFAAAWLFAVVVHIIGAVKANNGEWWNPPMTPNFVK
ncbi:MAG TPA: DUF4870 domain-containing protein [Ornithinibacter sp.]|nr:DUF4870 domain-containing protein [Ornithinibacter sp.]